MRDEYILEFLVLSQSCNYHAAAVELGISQPALSKHIKFLEESLGEQLFTRSTRNVELTPFGLMFLEHARRYSRMQTEMSQAVLQWQNRHRQILSIGTMPAAAEYGITECIAEFIKKNPGCYVELMDISVSRLKIMLKYGKCDLAFMPSVRRTDPEFETIPVTEDGHAVLLPRNHPLTRQRKVNVAQLQHESVHCLSTEMPTYDLYVEACRQDGITPNLEIAGAGTGLLVGVVEKNHGVSVLPRRQALKSVTPNIAVVNLEAPMQIYVNLMYLRNVELSALAQRFLDFARTFFGAGELMAE